VAITNRTIWTFWHQGFDQAPPLVQVAHPSWRRLNPGWRVVALDRHSISDWIDLPSVTDLRRRDLTLQTLSNIARLCLLRRYGGVWVDATVYCCGPLDPWLPKACDTGFFAYRNPGPDRLISSWMIAAEPANPILVAFYDRFLRLWQANRFSNHNTRFGKRAVEELSAHLNKDPRRTTCWLAPAIPRTIRAYPYYLFHYTFNKVILSDPELRRLWEAAEPHDAALPHRLQDLSRESEGRVGALTEIGRAMDVEQPDWQVRVRAEIGRVLGNVQKLDWRIDVTNSYWAAVLAALAALPAVADQDHATCPAPRLSPG
jgi:hypothetical protein